MLPVCLSADFMKTDNWSPNEYFTFCFGPIRARDFSSSRKRPRPSSEIGNKASDPNSSSSTKRPKRSTPVILAPVFFPSC